MNLKIGIFADQIDFTISLYTISLFSNENFNRSIRQYNLDRFKPSCLRFMKKVFMPGKMPIKIHSQHIQLVGEFDG